MKCKDCEYCKKCCFPGNTNLYVCEGVNIPFVIEDIDVQCTEYLYIKE